MWEPQLLTTLRASKACRGENFTLLYLMLIDVEKYEESSAVVSRDACRVTNLMRFDLVSVYGGPLFVVTH
jgi:hypothetical protein